MQKKKWIFTISGILLLSLSFSCQQKSKEKQQKSISPKLGDWRMEMKLGEEKLPFNFSLDKSNYQLKMVIRNADERIEVTDIKKRNDSLFIQLPIFESEFKLAIKDSTNLDGLWFNYYKSDDYSIPVKAEFGKSYRFNVKEEKSSKKLNGKYAVTFTEASGDSFPAIGLFEQNGNNVSGTFATETGDYRHLDGNIIDDSLFLSTFDGSHAFLFKAELQDSLIKGIFWSGTHYQADWTARKNESAKLRNPDSLTYIKEGYEDITFSFPNQNGNQISLADEQFDGKVKIVQIMGSWCPNCLDETNYLSKLYQQYHNDGLEIIALAFERSRSEEQAMKNLKSLKSKTDAEYPFLLAGWNRETKAEEVLPMLNQVMSFPTAIFIDRKGKVRKIHTGFYGPGTGEYYQQFTEETEAFVEQLLAE